MFVLIQSSSSVQGCTTARTATVFLLTNCVMDILTVPMVTMNPTAMTISVRVKLFPLTNLIIKLQSFFLFDCHLILLAFNISGFFHCRGSDKCVSQTEFCDGRVQCPHFADDEKHCQEPGSIMCDVIKYCDVRMIIINDSISMYLIFKDILCSSCKCHGNLALCASKNIISLPEVTNDDIRLLHGLFLHGNNLTEVSRDAFRGLHWLARLDLSHNAIERVDARAFRPLRNLLHLDLSFNRLTSLASETFKGLTNLRELSLRGNRLTVIRREHVSMLMSLVALHINDNDVKSAPFGTFDDVRL